MNERRFSASGGIFLFLGPVIGALIGVSRNEPIIGMLIGFVAGAAFALIICMIDRRKR